MKTKIKKTINDVAVNGCEKREKMLNELIDKAKQKGIITPIPKR